MIGFNALIIVSVIYVIFLFAIAFFADQQAARGRLGWLQSPIVYTLSLSIYCTAWTFYGAVGYAARSGLEFVTIYLGPTLIMIGWWGIVRKLVRIGRTQRITSIADLISSRFGKSNLLGVLVTLLAVIGSTPYIALQLQSVTLSYAVFANESGTGTEAIDLNSTAFWIAVGLILFTVLFGTRNLDANERHHGVVTAIAFEAVVKLVALLAVGVFVVWGVANGPSDILARIDASPIAEWDLRPGRWAGLIFLSAAAFLSLPRMFQVMVVENADERAVATASWAFPLYLMLMSLFVVPIAVVGLELMPKGANPDLFVLTIPLSMGQDKLALLSFLGGFSSATSMVIVAAIALSTMVSNHIVMPIWLAVTSKGATVSGDVRQVVLIARRCSIAAVLGLGYAYFHYSGGGSALAAIGLISFTGVSQVLPALLGAIFWRRATRHGAALGLIVGFVVWCYTLFLPSIGGATLISPEMLEHGPFGIGWLRPQALFGVVGLDPVIHAVVWSMLLNSLVFCTVSLMTFPNPLERLQGMQFVNVFEHSANARGWSGNAAGAEDLLVMSQRILGPNQAQRLFQTIAQKQGKAGLLPDPSVDFLEQLERELAGSVGAATAHAMVAQITGGASVSVEDLMAVADETAQIMEYSSKLEEKTDELERTARQLGEVNTKLTELSVQKDAFLGQISHELRTPMTSIRAFSEILRDVQDMTPDEQRHHASIIHDEALRLTRLLDDLLDLNVLENGQVALNIEQTNLYDVIERSLAAALSAVESETLSVVRSIDQEQIMIATDGDRLAQVFINLINNARKYCDHAEPKLEVQVCLRENCVEIDFRDNGTGISQADQNLIFEKFSRLTDHHSAGGAGLGLAICREIMTNLKGSIDYLPGQNGAAFRVKLPLK
ncbi:sensor histidine kinase [Cochlodiniinecator piscidefendens]|uniref:sensor histidine kinase n=1 Tax=Cochlodiniinecator piscidefendens TaxID=2715756 RepID=UPI00144637F7|nr:sensor histidine kinase [Cochlodiniinecator piscidefendens]